MRKQHLGVWTNKRLLPGKEYLHFLGIEVGRIESIPEGMVAWDLGDSMWTVWKARGGQDVIVSQEHIRWQWLDSRRGRCTGEFTAPPSAEATGKKMADREFWISGD